MRAIVLEKFGGLDSLVYAGLPEPEPMAGEVVIEIKAFGLNHAELHMRRGEWAEAAKVIGIECVGLVKSCPGGEFPIGAKVAALMGGLGRTINGSYAEYTRVRASNVAPIESDLPWAELAAIPETYAVGSTRACGSSPRRAAVSASPCWSSSAPSRSIWPAPTGPRMLEQTVQQAGLLDVLVDAAAVAPAEAFLAMTSEAWEKALLVNVRAVAFAMAAAAPVLQAQGGRRIIDITSGAARMALPGHAAYAATKAAVDSLTRTAAVALVPHGIRVNSLSPGMRDTPLQGACQVDEDGPQVC